MAVSGKRRGKTSFRPPYVPMDEGGVYVVSFDAAAESADEDAAAKAFFEENGFVVWRNVLTRDEAAATVSEMWSALEDRVPGFRRDDKESWHLWKSGNYSMPGGKAPMFSPQVLRNRQNPRLLHAHAVLYGHEDLLVNHDRWALCRPTKAVDFPSGSKDMPEWATRPSLHLDFNPWLYAEDHASVKEQLAALSFSQAAELYAENNAIVRSMGLQTQCVLNLVDNATEDGGFQLVPGFHKHFDTWVAGLPPMDPSALTKRSYTFNKTDAISSMSMRVPMAAGSIVVWDQRCAHGSRPNNSSNFRVAQFMRVFSARPEDSPAADTRFPARAACVLREVERAGIEVTHAGRVLFGLRHLPCGSRIAGAGGGSGGGGRGGSGK